MSQQKIRAVYMRGGTSRCLVFHDADLPRAGAERDRVLLAALGSPDPYGRQLDGMGGGISSLSKACIIGAPSHLGRYRLIRLLGEGGMGVVYEAEQDNPRRTVALKVVRPGLASTALLKRFHHESQILGRLHHPGIAQVYEAGVADDGRPYFAMEFIRGLPLDEYARAGALTLRDRLELLARVCDAVQHAHDQG